MNALSRHWQVAKNALEQDRARVRGLVHTEETAFLPAALEIVERPVSPTARITAWVLLAFLLVTLLWLVFGRVDIVAAAPGRLIPGDNVKLVQPAEAGIIRAILVRDGQRVKAGQPLVTMDPTVSTAEAVQAQTALETALLDAATARAVLSALDGRGLAFVAPKGTPPAVAATQARLAAARLAEIQAGTSGKAADSSAAAAAAREATIQAKKLEETIPLLDEQIAANEELLTKGYVAKLRVIEMRRQRLAAVRDRDIAYDTARRFAAQGQSAGSGYAQNRAEARARLLGELAKAESEANLRREELVKSSKRSSLQQLTAPVSGTVAQLSVHTVGGVVEPTKPIMVIVPAGGTLVADVKLLNKDAGFVAVGQPVTLKLEAFPFTRYGTVPGRVETVSSDAVEDEKLGLIYTVRVALDRTTIDRGDRTLPLTPGMAVTADIRTGSRTILSYIVSPINAARSEAGRER
jgi:hemolysin D